MNLVVPGQLLSAQLELEAKGYKAEVAQAAVRRISRYAERIANRCPPEIREQVYESIFRDQWQGAEEWAERYLKAMTD